MVARGGWLSSDAGKCWSEAVISKREEGRVFKQKLNPKLSAVLSSSAMVARGGWWSSDAGENLPNLRVLSLHQNDFYSTIPSNLCDLGNVQVLDLSSNNLSGIIPKCLQNLTSMTGKDCNGESNCYTYYERTSLSGRVSIFDSVDLIWKGYEV
ncbi:hypothetical protein BUALT_Bualt15G0095400 [Buddleja alternifolia]|uniref:Uncharacterized protein n=1 Tax=Buddleja alternifolia TaxID=168488 RepID=A0AAV6WE69_9LAMI|nr:hypothetical protein BUALT_Bualt15G0095400 [Buddleja alternifolia]